MIKPPNNKLVNWQECMNVSARHFIQTEDYFIDTARDYASLRLTHANYGLLPTSLLGKDNSNGIHISEHITGHIEVKLMHCNAITSSGVRINFNPDKGDYLIEDYSLESNSEQNDNTNSNQLDVIIACNPFKRVAFGELNPEETPPRHPDATTSYKLHVVPSGKINTHKFGLHHLTIGRIRKNANRYEVDGNYIPPCTTMSSHPDLMEYYNKLAQQLKGLEKSSQTIITKVQERTNQSELAENIKLICKDMLRYISAIYFDFRNNGKYMAPIEIIKLVSTLSHRVVVCMNFLKNSDKEQLLKYFYEWSGITPSSFEETLANTLEILYEHDKIRSIMLQAETFMTNMSELWLKMSQLDYIGQNKESIIVSERVDHQQDTTQKTHWSIFD